MVAAPHAATETSLDAVPMKKTASKGAQTIYVAPTGKTNATAGKNARHPLGSLTIALKRAKSGDTIILAPGMYTQSIGVSGKSDITIEGAAGQSSVIASSGDGVRVFSSSNITVENLAIRSQGRGVVVEGSSVNLSNVTTVGNVGDGLVATGYGGQNATVTATSSHFDGVQSADGMELDPGAIANISNCTFNNNESTGGGTGLILTGNAQATIVNSQFAGNLNANLVAQDQSQVTAQGSTFSNSKDGDGALITAQATVTLTGNTFASNGQVVGFASGFDGVEFYLFNGSAVVSGNTFSNNTGDGVFLVGTPQAFQITGNTFDDNLVGLNLGAGGTVNAVIQGNTFAGVMGSIDQGLVAAGSGVTATVGGSGSNANTFENFGNNVSIFEQNQNGQGQNIGLPKLVDVLMNNFLEDGVSVPASQAIGTCC